MAVVGVTACQQPDAEKIRASLESESASGALAASSWARGATARRFTLAATAAYAQELSKDSAAAGGKNVAARMRAPLAHHAARVSNLLDSLTHAADRDDRAAASRIASLLAGEAGALDSLEDSTKAASQ